MYKCSKCGMAVIVIKDHAPIKACTCEAAIIADLKAGLKGTANIKNGKQA
jgi:DNA-directed RNA polymerase subunit RPC12/RpoP